MKKSTIPGKLIDAVFRRVLHDEIAAPLEAQLLAAGVNVNAPAAAEVAKEIWYQAIELTAAALFPGHDGQRRLGRHVLDSLQSKKLVKGPFLTMAKMLGPKRALKQAAQYSDAFSPVPLRLEERDGKEVEVHADEGHQIDFLAGLLEGLVAALGGKDVRVLVDSQTSEKTVFVASWK